MGALQPLMSHTCVRGSFLFKTSPLWSKADPDRVYTISWSLSWAGEEPEKSQEAEHRIARIAMLGHDCWLTSFSFRHLEVYMSLLLLKGQ